MIRLIEELSFNAWVALQTMTYDGWIIRFSNGYTKRANSVNPIYHSTEDLATKILYCEDIFRDRNLKPVFKLTESSNPGNLDVVLEHRGYAAIDQSSVRLLNLSKSRIPSIHTVRISESLNDEWLNLFCMLSNQHEAKATMKQMLSMIVPKTCFISLYDGKSAVACGLGVLERGYLGIYDIVTNAWHRTRGYGEQLMLNLIKWGKENGAQYSYLQVMDNNEPALRLYSKLGYQERYRYWYRASE